MMLHVASGTPDDEGAIRLFREIERKARLRGDGATVLELDRIADLRGPGRQAQVAEALNRILEKLSRPKADSSGATE